jgi:hypothetical protein
MSLWRCTPSLESRWNVCGWMGGLPARSDGSCLPSRGFGERRPLVWSEVGRARERGRERGRVKGWEVIGGGGR